jgi:hypothetical protein
VVWWQEVKERVFCPSLTHTCHQGLQRASERLLMQVQSSSCPPAASEWGQWHETCPQNFGSTQIRFLEESGCMSAGVSDWLFVDNRRRHTPALSSNLDGNHARARARASCVSKPSPVCTSNRQPLRFADGSQPRPPLLSPRFSFAGIKDQNQASTILATACESSHTSSSLCNMSNANSTRCI